MKRMKKLTLSFTAMAGMALGACSGSGLVEFMEGKSTTPTVAKAAGPYSKPGFVTQIEDGRLWVFRANDKHEKAEKHISLIGAGPAGMTVKALNKETALAYIATREGFNVEIEDGRLWVFKAGGPAKKAEKHITLVGAGPRGMTIKALDKNTALEYIAAKRGFSVHAEDGRLWVFRAGSAIEKAEKHITFVGAGPRGMTIKAIDKETALAYIATKEGFDVKIVDGRIWVFRAGDKKEMSEKHVTMVGAGPRGMTVKAVDRDTANAYISAPPRRVRSVSSASSDHKIVEADPTKETERVFVEPANKPGFIAELEDGRIWVFRKGQSTEKSEKHITMIGVGPHRRTIKAVDRATAIEFLATKPGFVTQLEDGRLWVFEAGSVTEKAEKHISLIGAGPGGVTLKALDRKTALSYLAARAGFVTKIDDDGRIWVFRAGSDAEKQEKHVTLVGVGPRGTTLKGLDRDTLDAYLAVK